MNQITISKFRSNLAEYLESSKIEKKPLVIGKRNKQEFIIIPLNEENKKQLLETSFKNELEKFNKNHFSSLDEIKLSLTSQVQPPKE
jgi:prevent-host-death family protein